eukprot:scaffold36217_cov41-Phaeocystis_antarctica.AAC.2
MSALQPHGKSLLGASLYINTTRSHHRNALPPRRRVRPEAASSSRAARACCAGRCLASYILHSLWYPEQAPDIVGLLPKDPRNPAKCPSIPRQLYMCMRIAPRSHRSEYEYRGRGAYEDRGPDGEFALLNALLGALLGELALLGVVANDILVPLARDFVWIGEVDVHRAPEPRVLELPPAVRVAPVLAHAKVGECYGLPLIVSHERDRLLHDWGREENGVELPAGVSVVHGNNRHQVGGLPSHAAVHPDQVVERVRAH